jgi:hypothetical protein
MLQIFLMFLYTMPRQSKLVRLSPNRVPYDANSYKTVSVLGTNVLAYFARDALMKRTSL